MRTIYLLALLLFPFLATAQNPLPIPPALTGTEFELHLQKGAREFFPGFTTNTMGVNGDLLGPTLILNKGDLVTMNLINELDEPTTIHWHGMHVSAANDGGPHTVIEAGTTWSPQFTVLDHAATYWYHPHLHMKTAEHVTKGIAGFIIVKDEEEAALELPRSYGEDDFPIVIQSRAFDADMQFIVETAADDVLLVNGVRDPYLEVPAQVVRLRLLNGSTDRTYNLGFEGNIEFFQIATDGGLLGEPLPMDRLQLAPGERAEILLNLNGMAGQSLTLKSFSSELASGIYGAASPSPMPVATIPGYSSNPLNGSDFDILKLNVGSPSVNPITAIPATLVPQNPIPEASAQQTRNLTFQPQQMGPTGMANGPFVINGASFNLDVINFEIPLGNTEIWQLTNMTGISHPFHIHDVQFYVLDVNGAPPPANMLGRKDVVLVPPMGGTVRFITRFEDFADDEVPYMYHCHMLTHEDAGMMGQFIVTGPNATKEPSSTDGLKVYPNPAIDAWNLVFEVNTGEEGYFVLRNSFGQTIRQFKSIVEPTVQIPCAELPAGWYIMEVRTGDQNYVLSVLKR